jgi:phosphatidate cytidylyltransferase
LNNLITRTLTGAIFLILIIGSILLGSITYYLIFSIILILSQLEFYNLSTLTKASPQKWLGIFTGWLLFTFNFLYAVDFIQLRFFLIFIPLFILFLVNELYLYHKRPFTSVAFTFLGILYVAVPFSLLNYFVFQNGLNIIEPDKLNKTDDVLNQAVDIMSVLNPKDTVVYTPYLLLGFFIQIWVYDTFAYLFGVWLGKHRLFERISPKKSWEGLIGGMVVTVGLSFFLPLLFPYLLWYNWMILGGIVVIASTYGDLVESLYKRSLNIKDSGNILPGHGGILDRFDSVLIAAPIAYIYILSCF